MREKAPQANRASIAGNFRLAIASLSEKYHLSRRDVVSPVLNHGLMLASLLFHLRDL
jgi:hypothetical protein